MTTSTDAAAEAFEAAWNEWHGETRAVFPRPAWLGKPDRLYWLTDQFETVGDLPGRWRADADTLYVDGIDTLEPIEGAPGLRVEDGDRRIEVIRRTGSAALRIHDPKSSRLAAFEGVPTYATSERCCVSGTFTPYEQPRRVTTGAVVEELEHHYEAVGVIDFELAETALQLVDRHPASSPSLLPPSGGAVAIPAKLLTRTSTWRHLVWQNVRLNDNRQWWGNCRDAAKIDKKRWTTLTKLRRLVGAC